MTLNQTHFKATRSRKEILQSIPNRDWDIVIVGGGVTGAGIFRQATKAGFKTLLIEQQDFAWGTSSRSSKLVHGGFRYIAQGDVQLTKKALEEREQMLKEVPGLVDRHKFIFPLRKDRFPGRFLMTTLFKVYDFLAGVQDCSFIKQDILGTKVKGIDKHNISGAISYSDAVTDDSRLVLRLIQEGKSYKGTAINYIKAELKNHSFARNKETGEIESINVVDSGTGEVFAVKLKVLVNATGVWADNLMELAHQSNRVHKKIRAQRGSHLVLKADKFPITEALTLIHPKDGRPIFMLPWFGRILLGTTDIDYPENINKEAVISHREINYLFEVVNEFFPDSQCGRDDVVSSFCGLRTIIKCDKANSPLKEKRGHSIWLEKNLITVTGGKLTIFRVIANEVLESLKQVIGSDKQVTFDLIFNEQKSLPMIQVAGIDENYQKIIIGRYGDQLNIFLSAYAISEYLQIENYGFSIADCRWAIEHEQVEHLDDIMFRRTRLGLLQDNTALLKRICGFLQEHLEWTHEQEIEELERYQNIKNNYYCLP